jgi:hypothetical protein
MSSSDHQAVTAPGRLGTAAQRRNVGSLLRQHWLAASLLAAGLVLRVLADLAYRPALFYIDSPRYLYDAQGMDPVGYKAPLRAILVLANFDAVVAFQHLLALAMAVVLYVLLLRRGAWRWLAALAIAPLLLDAYQIQDEQTIMPGTWFEALIVAGLAILLWRPRITWRTAGAAGLALGTAATFAQVGEALLLPALIFVVALGGGWRPVATKAAALAGAFVLPILAYCTGSYVLTGAFYLSHQGVTSFYGRTAAAVDCTTIKLPAAERAMCPTPAEQAKGNDWLEYNPASPVQVHYYHLRPVPMPRDQVNSLISDFGHRVLAQQPGRVFVAYLRDVIKPFALTRGTSRGDPPISRWQFQASYQYFPPWVTRQWVATAVDRYGGGAPAVWLPVARFLRAYQLDGGWTPGPLLAVCVLAGLLGSAALLARRRLVGQGRQMALACLLLFGSGVFVLLVSDTFVFSWRYQLTALVTLVPAGALGIGVLASMISGRASTRRSGRHGVAHGAHEHLGADLDVVGQPEQVAD